MQKAIRTLINIIGLLTVAACGTEITPTPTREVTSTLAPTATLIPTPRVIELAIENNRVVARGVGNAGDERELFVLPPDTTNLREIARSVDGQVLLVDYQVPVNGANINLVAYQSGLINGRALQVTPLITETIKSAVFSPNGEWLAYRLTDFSAHAEGKRLSGMSKTLNGLDLGSGEHLPHNLFLADVNKATTKLLAACHPETAKVAVLQSCSTNKLVWTFDSKSLVWADVFGVQRYFLTGQMQLVVGHKIQPVPAQSPAPSKLAALSQSIPPGTVIAFYQPTNASPYDFHVWLEIIGYEGNAQGMLDLESGKVGVLEGSWHYLQPNPIVEMHWLPDGKIEVALNAGAREIWHIDPTTEALLVLDN